MNDAIAPNPGECPPGLRIERDMLASPKAIYRALTTAWDRWFSKPGSLRTQGGVGDPYVHVVEHEGQRHPHYGRFLRLEADRLVELSWVTGKGGTEGAETVLTVELEPRDSGTRLTLSHQGFYTQEAARRTEEAWPHVLAHLDACMANESPASSGG